MRDVVWERLLALARGRHRQLGLAAVVGLLTGLAVAGFDWVVATHMLDRLERMPLAVQAIAPAVGLGLAALALRMLAGGASPATSDEYIRNYHEPGRSLELTPVVGRLVAAAATLGFGGAMGFEGPSMYLGASVGTRVQARFRRWFDPGDLKLLMVAGAAAGVAAIFKTPATGAIFAIEVPYQDDTAKRMLFPALVAAVCGYLVFVAINGTTPLFPINGSPPFGLRELSGAAALGLLAGCGARGFAMVVRAAKRWQARTNRLVAVAVGGGLMAGLAVASRVVFGQTLTIGSGYEVITWVATGPHPIWAVAVLLVFRAVATPATVGGGGAGGMFVPLVVLGALVGDGCGLLVHEPTQTLFPVIGVAAFLGAGYRTPLAAVMFVAESTGRPGFIVPGVIAAVVSQLVMGRQSVSPYQLPRRAGPLERRLSMSLESAIETDVVTVDAGTTVEQLVARQLHMARHRPVPVLEEGQLVGLLHTEEVTDLDRDQWGSTEVGRLVSRDQPVARPVWTVEQAVRAMDAADDDVLAVTDEHGHFLGLVTLSDLVRLDEVLGSPDEDQDPGGSP